MKIWNISLMKNEENPEKPLKNANEENVWNIWRKKWRAYEGKWSFCEEIMIEENEVKHHEKEMNNETVKMKGKKTI